MIGIVDGREPEVCPRLCSGIDANGQVAEGYGTAHEQLSASLPTRPNSTRTQGRGHAVTLKRDRVSYYTNTHKPYCHVGAATRPNVHQEISVKEGGNSTLLELTVLTDENIHTAILVKGLGLGLILTVALMTILVGSCRSSEAWVEDKAEKTPPQGLLCRLDSRSHRLRFIARWALSLLY